MEAHQETVNSYMCTGLLLLISMDSLLCILKVWTHTFKLLFIINETVSWPKIYSTVSRVKGGLCCNIFSKNHFCSTFYQTLCSGSGTGVYTERTKVQGCSWSNCRAAIPQTAAKCQRRIGWMNAGTTLLHMLKMVRVYAETASSVQRMYCSLIALKEEYLGSLNIQ